jgi:hypothetical protein
MNDAHGAPGRTSGRAQPRAASNHGASNHDLLAALDLEDKVRLLTGADNWRTCPLPAIGLRSMVMSDGPAGVRGQTMDERNPSASLPCPSALGATWDPELVREVAFALGSEAKSKGVDVLLAPTINVMRTPLGGRGFESFGEDPVLIARMAVAYVDGLRRAGVAAAAKHYVGNDSETQRWTYDARIAEHVLRELYLVPFEACVREADLDLVMTGYNMVNGVTMTEHALLLMSFYGFFRDKEHPLGKTRLWVCRSLACGLRGADELLDSVCKKLNVSPGSTSADGKITVEFAECIGACEGAPAVLIDDEARMNVTPDKVDALLDELRQ